MPDYGTTAGIGKGIGEALGSFGEAIQKRKERQSAERDKQAENYEKQAQDIAANIAQLPGGREAPEAQPMLQELYGVVQRHNALYPAHETPALVARIQRVFGKQPGPPTPDVRAGLTAGSVLAAAPQQQPGFLGQMNQFVQAYRLAYQGEKGAGGQPLSDAELLQRARKEFMDRGGTGQGRNILQEQQQHAQAYILAHRGEKGEDGQPLTDEQLKQAGLKDFMDTGTTTAGKYQFQGTVTDPATKEVSALWVNPQNPSDTKTVKYPAGFQPKTTGKAPADYKEQFGPGGRLLYITAAGQDGVVKNWDATNINDPNVQPHIKDIWDKEQKEITAAEKSKRDFQKDLAQTRSDIQLEHQKELIPFQIGKQYSIKEATDAQKKLDKSQTQFRDINLLWDEAQRADAARNAQQDELLMRAVMRAVAPGRMDRTSIERLATRGTKYERLEDLYNLTWGGQELPGETRQHLIDAIRTIFNDRLRYYQEDYQNMEQIRANTPGLGPGPGPKNAPPKQANPWGGAK